MSMDHYSNKELENAKRISEYFEIKMKPETRIEQFEQLYHPNELDVTGIEIIEQRLELTSILEITRKLVEKTIKK